MSEAPRERAPAAEAVKEGGAQRPGAGADDLHLMEGQVYQLYAHSRPGAIGAMAGGVVLTAALWYEVPHGRLLIWILSYLVLHASRIRLVEAFNDAAPTGPVVKTWERRFHLGAGLGCFWWGLAAIFLFPTGSIGHQFILAACVAGINGAGAVIFSATNCYISCIIAGLLPLSARFAYEGGTFGLTMAGVILLYTLVLVLAGARLNAFNKESIKLRWEKNDLVESLTREKEQVERLNRDLTAEINERVKAENALREAHDELEVRVADRTADLAHELRKFRALHDLALGLTTESELDRNLQFAVETVRELLDTDTAFILMRDEMSDDLLMRSASGIRTEEFQNLRIAMGQGLGGTVAKTGEGLIVDDYYKEVEPTFHEICRKEGIVSGLAVPLSVGVVNLGVLPAFNRSMTKFSRADLDTLLLVGNMIAVEIMQKRADAALRQSEERYKDLYYETKRTGELYRTLLDASPDPIVVYNMKGWPTYINPAFTDLFGWRLDEIAGRCMDFIPEESMPETQDLIDMVLRGENFSGRESKRFTKHGRVIDVSVSGAVYFGRDGSVAGSVVNLRDITERKLTEAALRQAHDELEERVRQRTAQLRMANEQLQREIGERARIEAELRESEEKYRTIIDNIVDAYYEVDLAGTFTFVNDSGPVILGYKKHEIVGKNYQDLSLVEESRKIQETFNTVRRTGKPVKAHYWRFIAKGGSPKDLELSVSLRRDAEGRITGFRGIARDVTERRRAEEVIRRNEETARALLNATTDAAALMDVWGTVLASNEVFAARVGLTAHDVIGRNISRILDPARDGERKRRSEEVFRTGRPVRFVDVQDDTYMDFSIYPVFDAYGAVERIAVFSRDITEQRRTEEALARETERFQTLSEHSPFGMLTITSEGRVSYVNPKFTELFGYELWEIPTGADWFRKAFPDRALRRVAVEEWKTYEKIARPGEEGSPRVFPVRCKNGTEKIIHFRPVQLDTGDHVVTCEDVTELRRAEEALLESEARYRILVETARDMIWSVDLDLFYTYVNPSVSEILGYSLEEIMSMTPLSLVPPSSRDRFRELLLGRVEADGDEGAGETSARVEEVEHIHKDGSIRWLETTTTPLRDVDGAIAGILGISRDVTDRKMAARELERALAVATQLRTEAEAANRSKSEFLANMSHELRTPLNAIIGFSEILEDQTFGRLSSKQSKYIGHVLQAGRHLLQLINDILDLSKVESGRIDLHPSLVDVGKVIEGSMVMIKERALRRRLEINVRIDEEVSGMRIQADEIRLKQIMFNLLSNATKFTDEGGRIRVDAWKAGEELLVSVSDTGIGLKREDTDRIFQAFEQVDSSYARQRQGTGLGLALTQRLVALHGGRIWAESEGLGKGSVFTFALPAAGVESAAPAPADRPPLLSAGGEKGAELAPEAEDTDAPLVLVVEDDPATSDLICEYLREAGYRSGKVFRAEEAADAARRLQPAAITLDVFLPDSSGFDVLIELKADPKTHDIPVIMITISDDRDLGVALGAVDFIVKPVDRERVIRSLSNIEPRGAGSKMKVLVVDDDPAVLKVIGDTLRPLGYEVVEADNGESGIRAALERSPDVIILDLIMPGMTGFEVVEELGRHSRTMTAPIYLYTCRDLTDKDRERLNRRVEAVVPKSGGRERLLEILENLRKSRFEVAS